jgi:hypothetical protein
VDPCNRGGASGCVAVHVTDVTVWCRCACACATGSANHESGATHTPYQRCPVHSTVSAAAPHTSMWPQVCYSCPRGGHHVMSKDQVCRYELEITFGAPCIFGAYVDVYVPNELFEVRASDIAPRVSRTVRPYQVWVRTLERIAWHWCVYRVYPRPSHSESWHSSLSLNRCHAAARFEFSHQRN